MCFCAAWALACILRVARTSADGQRVECVPDRKESQQAIRQQWWTKASLCPHDAPATDKPPREQESLPSLNSLKKNVKQLQVPAGSGRQGGDRAAETCS